MRAIKLSVLRTGLLLVWSPLCWCLAPDGKAADVLFYAVEQGLKYNQGTAGPPTLGSNRPYRFGAIAAPAVSGSILSATATGPAPPTEPLTLDPATLWLVFNAKFASQSELSAATPSGKYSFVLN